MEKTIIVTRDGSHSIAIPAMDLTYHSVHGAIQESGHVFIQAGLQPFFNLPYKKPLQILEMGLGTGLNALLTLAEAEKAKRPVVYCAIELSPLPPEQAMLLNYCEQLGRPDLLPAWKLLHECEWDKEIALSPHFSLLKKRISLLDYSPAITTGYDLVYFDAFAPSAQPELWTVYVFEKLFAAMAGEGMLVTYCSKSDVRRAMQAAGFRVEKIPGPRGKREMLRAMKQPAAISQ